jgi:hypothetical protein
MTAVDPVYGLTEGQCKIDLYQVIKLPSMLQIFYQFFTLTKEIDMNFSIGFKQIVALVILLAGAHIQTAQALPTLQLDSSNQLLGATGVLIDGLSYDVQFIPTSCDLIWSGCDPHKFLFKTLESATTASQALLDQVLLDIGPGQLYDTEPSTIYHGSSFIFIWTPYLVTDENGGTVFVTLADNESDENLDSAPGKSIIISPNRDYAHGSLAATYAKWSVSTESVPEPSVMLLMTSGLIAFGVVKRKARTSNSV